jgi:beta-aspartyl-peptidase (threonine type)
MTDPITPRLIVHGGAGAWTDADETAVLEGVRQAAAAGWDALQRGETSLAAVEVATIVLEDHPLFDAGIGSHLSEQGEVEMDALITDGTTRRFGAIACVRRVRNPIVLARLVLQEPRHCFFVGDGAEELAVKLGLTLVPNLTFVTEAELAAYHRYVAEQTAPQVGTGTVGAVAVDAAGHIASATSTGGVRFKKKGRVGDVPVYGAGGYSDDRCGGASATGVGENIMRTFLSRHAVDLMRDQDAFSAARSAIAEAAAFISDPEVGVIVIDARGDVGAAHTTHAMPIAWIDPDGAVQSAMRGPYDMA